jgi:hypothetical protein
MTICPVAIAVGCKKCPIFKVCPVKSVIGDYKPAAPTADAPKTATKSVYRKPRKSPAKTAAKSAAKAATKPASKKKK